MVEVGLAFVAFICALVAWSATAALIARCYRNPRPYMVVWVVSSASMAIALSAAFPGALLDFSPVTFRIFQIGVGLLAPLTLGWGAVEYAVDSARARFGVRLVVTTLAIVPLVVLSIDQLRGEYDAGYPPMADHYDIIPQGLLALVHLFAVIAILACAIVVARRRHEQPRLARHQSSVLGLIGLAAVLEILVDRFGLSILGQLILLGAIGCLWTAFAWAQKPPREGPGRRRGGRRRSAGYAEGADDDDEPFESEEDGVWGRRRREPEYDDYEDGPVTPQRAARLRGVITIYTLAEGGGDTFDDCADEVVDEVARREADTLLFVCHSVPSAPLQRIIYAIYRDELAVKEHEQQPHVVEFVRRTSGCVVATNVIELTLSGASASDSLAGMLMAN